VTIQLLHPPGKIEPECLVARCPIRTLSIEEVPLAHADEVSTFVMQKRRDEHLTGRWLLAEVLRQLGHDPSLLTVERTQHRAPYLAYIHGVWKNTPLPSISVGHSDGWAYVAAVGHGWRIGVDAEARDRGIQANAFDMMAKGEELERLNADPDCAIEMWVSKEAIQKALGLGMHLNPREIEIPIGVQKDIISIEKSKIQLIKWIHQEAQIALAITPGSISVVTAEDRLLEVTKVAMSEGDWGVGCNTVRNNV
jgi:phosphopantetheinyl transferase